MISYELIAWCLGCAAVYLLVVSAVFEWIGRSLNLAKGLPESMVEKADLPGFIVNFMMETLFYVAVPTIAYTFFYMIIPMSGPKAGMAITLIAFTLGAIPIMMVLSVRIKVPMPMILYLVFTQLVKLGGCLIIIGYLYNL